MMPNGFQVLLHLYESRQGKDSTGLEDLFKDRITTDYISGTAGLWYKACPPEATMEITMCIVKCASEFRQFWHLQGVDLQGK